MNFGSKRPLAVLVVALLLGAVAGLNANIRAGEIALSFDDAPRADGPILTGAERGRMLIEKLDSLGIEEVVFFCTTENLVEPERRQRLLDYANAGHRLGNHSHYHQRPRSIGGAPGYIFDFDRAHDSLSQFDGFVRWFRYPMLDHGHTEFERDSIRIALAERGYKIGYVTVDNYDWYFDRRVARALDDGDSIDYERLAEFYVETLWDEILFYEKIAQEALGRSPKHVLLLHENDLAALFLDTLVTHIRAQGWTIISPTDAYTDPIADSIPDVLFNNQGRVAAIARAQGIPAWKLVHRAEDRHYIDSLFVARKIIRK